MVFQIPYIPYSYGLQTAGVSSFDYARPYIQSTSLRWSWGTMNGSEQEQWEQGVSELPPEAMIREVIARGFRGLWIDTYGYADRTMIPVKEITTVTGHQPIASSNGRYLFFDLRGVHLPLLPTLLKSLPEPYVKSPIGAGGKCNVDSIDWKPLSGALIAVNQSSMLYLNGWVADVDKGLALPNVYIELASPNGNEFYLRGSRNERPDVAAAFKESSLMQSGFAAAAKLAGLPQGIYRIRILQLGSNRAEGCDFGAKLDVK
jgi:hypothetical protein